MKKNYIVVIIAVVFIVLGFLVVTEVSKADKRSTLYKQMELAMQAGNKSELTMLSDEYYGNRPMFSLMSSSASEDKYAMCKILEEQYEDARESEPTNDKERKLRDAEMASAFGRWMEAKCYELGEGAEAY